MDPSSFSVHDTEQSEFTIEDDTGEALSLSFAAESSSNVPPPQSARRKKGKKVKPKTTMADFAARFPAGFSNPVATTLQPAPTEVKPSPQTGRPSSSAFPRSFPSDTRIVEQHLRHIKHHDPVVAEAIEKAILSDDIDDFIQQEYQKKLDRDRAKAARIAGEAAGFAAEQSATTNRVVDQRAAEVEEEARERERREIGARALRAEHEKIQLDAMKRITMLEASAAAEKKNGPRPLSPLPKSITGFTGQRYVSTSSVVEEMVFEVEEEVRERERRDAGASALRDEHEKMKEDAMRRIIQQALAANRGR